MECLNNLPLVSILIPAYNQTKYLKIALESAINQTYKNVEIIVGDDSTTDEVKALVFEYMKIESNIIYINNGGPLGEMGIANIENLFRKASGEYISFLFHDDEYFPTKVEKMINKFMEDKSLTLVTSNRLLINEKSNVIENLSAYNQDIKISGKDVARAVLYSVHNFIGECTTVMFRKKDILDDNIRVLDYYQSKMKCLGDIALFFKLCAKGNVFFINEELSKFRRHTQQNTNVASIINWAPIDFMNLIIDSYEKNLFINSQEELMWLVDIWRRAYSYNVDIAINTFKKSEEEKKYFLEFKSKLLKYHININGL